MNCLYVLQHLFNFLVVYFCAFLENVEENSSCSIGFYFKFYIKFTTFKLKTITFFDFNYIHKNYNSQ